MRCQLGYHINCRTLEVRRPDCSHAAEVNCHPLPGSSALCGRQSITRSTVWAFRLVRAITARSERSCHASVGDSFRLSSHRIKAEYPVSQAKRVWQRGLQK